ncbi:hypothetical protein BD410DRAFT_179226 [Rickenella mellea]|uniref:Uncharacterized protein n=1 Tax=Rickenella mellea TaxID=50990 RepID=A0A4Y7Q7P6_9AGAM|nr:hypothetical protein BD410DRAFT_179226 [Rickenella mellea]
MNRLTLFETNSTLYARYVEEQTRSVREALRRLEEDVGRLEGIGKAQAQFFQRTSQDWLAQRDKLEREYVELLSRVNYLTDEVILEKRLGIAQLALLLTVLVFMALTRGSRGESFISHNGVNLKSGFGRRNSLREWGRRNLSFSGEWVKRCRSRSPTPAKGEEQDDGIGTGKIKFPTSRSQEIEIELEPSLSRRTPSALKPRQQIPTRTPRTPATNRNSGSLRPVTPPSARAAGFGGGNFAGGMGDGAAGGREGNGRPQLQRSDSHSTPAGTIGPVLRSAKKWAKSAHLHEIQPGSGAAMRHRGHGGGGTGGTGGGERERERERQPNADGDGVARQNGGKENAGNGGPAPSAVVANGGSGHAGGNGDVFWSSTPTPRMPTLGSPWTPTGVKSSPDADEADAWVDTDVEGSEGGQEVAYVAS